MENVMEKEWGKDSLMRSAKAALTVAICWLMVLFLSTSVMLIYYGYNLLLFFWLFLLIGLPHVLATFISVFIIERKPLMPEFIFLLLPVTVTLFIILIVMLLPGPATFFLQLMAIILFRALPIVGLYDAGSFIIATTFTFFWLPAIITAVVLYSRSLSKRGLFLKVRSPKSQRVETGQITQPAKIKTREKIWAAVLGYFTLVTIYSYLLIIFLWVTFFATGKVLPFNKYVFGSFSFLALIVGPYIGIKLLKSKTAFRELVVLKPKAIILSFIITFVFSLITYVQFGGFFSLPFLNLPLPAIMLMGMIGTFFYNYPFSSLVVALFDKKNRAAYKKSLLTIAILILIFNPIFLMIGNNSARAYEFYSLNEPCGLKITGFTEISPVREAGLKISDVITFISYSGSGKTITNSKDFQEFKDPKFINEELTIRTKGGSTYFVTPVDKNNSAFFGFVAVLEYCETDNPGN